MTIYIVMCCVILVLSVVAINHTLNRVSITYSTETIHNPKNSSILHDIAKSANIKLCRPFVSKYEGTIDTKGYYGTTRKVQFSELHFSTSSDKLMFLLKYPDRLTLGKEILNRGGTFDLEHVDITEDL